MYFKCIEARSILAKTSNNNQTVHWILCKALLHGKAICNIVAKKSKKAETVLFQQKNMVQQILFPAVYKQRIN